MNALRRFLVGVLTAPAQFSGAGLVALGYAAVYLWMTGDLASGGRGGVDAVFPAWERVWMARGALQYEPVGLITVGTLVWSFSPLNLLQALFLGSLVGLNFVAAWRVWRAPRSCGLKHAATGLAGTFPALLAGGACCAPLLLIWLGLPIAGTIAGLAPFLVPGAILLLVLGLWIMARRITASGP